MSLKEMQQINSSNADNSSKEKQSCLNVHQHVMRKNCQVICISKNKKMLLLGAKNDLIIMNFTPCNGQSKQINKLRGHKGEIICIEIINSDLEIITAGIDGRINIWKKKQQWKLFQSIENNTIGINRIIVDKSENLIISNYGNIIKFWNKQDDGWQCIQQIQPFEYLYNPHLLLNDKCDTLVIILFEDICIVQLQPNNIWQIKLRFNIRRDYGLRNACFIKNDVLAFFTYNSEILIYQLDQNHQLNNIKNIRIQTEFLLTVGCQVQYSIYKEQLIIKTSGAIVFIKFNQNYDLVQQYEIIIDRRQQKVLIIEELYLLIYYNYYYGYSTEKNKRIFQIQNYKKSINLE